MGLHSENTSNGASVLVIDQACDNDQLLVSLSKNGTQWLSPVGWTDQQKVTLLDCRQNGETTEVDIPAEFARDIKSGDVLVLRCSELDLEKEITWEASSVETRNAIETAPAAVSLAGGLLSRFKGSKVEAVEEVKSEAELRAEEADRAAQNFKAKMEAATAAKEEAQRRALDAAREAEAALKMEADRIAEMERAAKAFEEAERLKQDELRRVDEERRAEEARLAEEARRIEAVRKREIAAKKDAERKASLERYEAALDITRNEELRLKSRLKDLTRQAQVEAENNAVQTEDLQNRKGLLVNTEETVSKRAESYEKSASKLDVMTADLSILQSESETLEADHQALSIRLSQADADYQQAQKEAEVAMANAETKRSELESVRHSETDVSERILSISEKLTSKNQIVADASDKTQKLHSKLETAQAELTQATVEIEALEQALRNDAEKDQNLRLEIEATQQAIEDSQARELAHRGAIDHLEAGGAPEDIAEISFEARSYEPSSTARETEPVLGSAKLDEAGLKERMMGRVRRSFAREKDAEISIDVDDVIIEASKDEADSVLLAGLDDTPSFVRRHGSSLMALGAVIGGIALLGGGYALNKSVKPTLSVKSSAPVPKQVLSAVAKNEQPTVSNLNVKDTVAERAPMAKERMKIDTADDVPASAAEPLTEETILAPEVEAEGLVVKLADVVDPTGFAFDLPDMMPKAQVKKAELKPVTKKEETPKAQKVEVKKPKVTKTADVKKIEPVLAPKTKTEVNYPELTSDVQTRLSKLGFYTGEIDGVQGTSTKEAIANFKTLFAMTETNDKISGAFLTELKRVEQEQDVAEAKALEMAEREAQAAIQVAEAAPSVEFYDSVQVVPTAPVVTDALPATEATPTYIAPEPEPAPVQVASIPNIVEPVVKDVIVEAKMIKNASTKYPQIALRKNYFANISIIIDYDIDAEGRTTNIQISSNDHDGRYNEFFEKEALKAVKKMRFEPKTVNGVAVQKAGNQKRVVFRTE